MFFHVNTRKGCVVLTNSSVKHSFNPKAFWSEIKNMNNCKTPLPTSTGCIEGVSGGVQIVEFWRTHFSQLLNCVSNSSVHACEYGCDTPL